MQSQWLHLRHGRWLYPCVKIRGTTVDSFWVEKNLGKLSSCRDPNFTAFFFLSILNDELKNYFYTLDTTDSVILSLLDLFSGAIRRECVSVFDKELEG